MTETIQNPWIDLAADLLYEDRTGQAQDALCDGLREETDSAEIVRLFNHLAIIERDKGNYIEALRIYTEAERHLKDCRDDLARAKSHHGKATTYLYLLAVS